MRPGLARAEQLAGPAQLEIDLGQLEAVRRLDERLQARDRGLRELLLRPRDEQAVRLLRAPAPHGPELVQLRQPEAVGLLHDHDRRVRHVDADLDHRRGDEHVELSGLEARHEVAPLGRPQLAVHAADPQPRSSARCNRSASCSAARASIATDSDTSGQTTYACLPASRWRRRRV